MIRYFDMFAGVGGFRAGLAKAGGFECIGHSEIDKYADASYRAVHSPKESEVFYPDARAIEPNSMPDFDLLCGGFPCQSFSLAGQRKGFDDVRGTLFFELARIAAAKRPNYLLFENVPGLLSHDKGKTFAVILNTICELGYCVEWMVLNSKDFGVPQSRRRVFLVGYLDERCAGKILPYGAANPKALIQIKDGPQGSRIYDAEGLACTQTAGAGGKGGKTGLYFMSMDSGQLTMDNAGHGEQAVVESEDNGKFAHEEKAEQKAVFVDMTYGSPQVTNTARCLTAHYAKSCMSRHSGENSGVFEATDDTQWTNGNCPLSTVNCQLAYGSPQVTNTARCLTANYNKSRMSAHKGEMSGVLEEACAVLTPDREKARQDGRRIKSPGEPMFTLTAQDKHGVLLIKEATQKGYKEAHEGDSVDLGYTGSNTRRGRVGRDIAHTLDTGSTQGVVRKGRIRRLTPRECFRLQGFEDEQIDKILAITSDAQAYKQAGNAVTVNVIEAIGRRIKAVDDMLKGGDAA